MLIGQGEEGFNCIDYLTFAAISPLSALITIDKRLSQIIAAIAISWILTRKLKWTILCNRSFVFIGDRSYSIYLTYWTYRLFIGAVKDDSFINSNFHGKI